MKRISIFVFAVVVLFALFAAPSASHAQDTCNPKYKTTTSGTEWDFTGCTPAEAKAWMDVMNGTAVPGTAVTPGAPAAPTATPTTESLECPSLNKVNEDFGFTALKVDVKYSSVDWDFCKWDWQASGLASITLKIPASWSATVTTTKDRNVVQYVGPVTVENVKGFTIRKMTVSVPVGSKWSKDPVQLLARVNRFGLVTVVPQVDAYVTYNGNIPITTTCPVTSEEVATLVGGDAKFWSRPSDAGDWIGGAFVYSSTETARLTVPAGYPAWIDYWTESGVKPAWSGDSVNVNSASFHCHNHALPTTPEATVEANS